MDLSWSIDDVVRTSDEAAVRQRFARRNLFWLAMMFASFVLVGLIEALGYQRRNTPFDVMLAVGQLAFVALGLFLARYASRRESGEGWHWRAAALLRRHINAVAIASVAILYVLSLAFTRRGDEWAGWVVTFPLLMLGFRMLVAELVLLHGFLLAGGLLMNAVSNVHENGLPFTISMIVINVLALGTELFFSRRMRQSVVGEWTSRRTQAREQIRMRDELRYARELQLSMLPECAPSLDWADICSVSIPATEVGGDYYDYFVEKDRVALICGDVAGHGMAAGLVLAGVRSGLTLLRDSLGEPASVLRRLHDLILQTTRRRMLVTVSVALVDRTSATVTIASAGHPPAMIRRADGAVETIDLFAPPLGVRLPVAIPQRRVPFGPGDTLVLHSDGIYECRNEADESYGLERLARVIGAETSQTAEGLREAILRDVATFRGSVDQNDDVTIVVCRLTAPVPPS
jgi:hypothetical protein